MHSSITMGSQVIIFGGFATYDGDSGFTETIETEVWDFETGEKRLISPALSQYDNPQVALYFVDDAKFCEVSGETPGVPTWIGGGMNPSAIEW